MTRGDGETVSGAGRSRGRPASHAAGAGPARGGAAEVVVAHLSDFHVATRPRLRQINAKRLLALVNWRARRRGRHRVERIEAAVAALVAEPPGVVVVTGDMGQFGLVGELEEGRRLLRPLTEAGVPILLVSGNHDAYGRSGRTLEHLATLRRELARPLPVEPPGWVRVGPLAILLMDQAEKTPLFRSWGRLEAGVLAAMARRLAEERPPVALLAGHYPLCGPGGRALPPRAALRDGGQLHAFLTAQPVSAYLCGHVHEAFTHALDAATLQHCAGSLSIHGQALRLRCSARGVEPMPPVGGGASATPP